MKGEYRHTIDAKGRLAMPAKLRDELGEHFTVTKGLDGCLFVYPDAEWASLEARIRSLGNGEKARTSSAITAPTPSMHSSTRRDVSLFRVICANLHVWKKM